jgi:DNA recombination protein RmuC
MDQTSFLLVTAIVALLGLMLGYLAGKLNARKNSREADLQKQVEVLSSEIAVERNQVEGQRIIIERANEEVAMLRREKETEKVLVSRLQAEKEQTEKQLSTHLAEVKTMQESFRKDFELLANRIFEEKSEKFGMQNKASLDQVLEPLKERLKSFQDKVEETHKDNIKETSSLRQEIKSLKETSQRMSAEAENLTRALKNDSKTQGNWGEMILESMLESSGLVKDREYFIQQNFTNEEGKRFQPDVMVKLPDEKWIIVDSKVSLTAYENFISAETEDSRGRYLKQHLASLRQHIKGLAAKDYQHVAEGKNLDFILMFIPIEPAYLTALNAEPSLFNEAYEKNIVLVCPTTLIASLKIIASTWKHEYQNKNALEIADRGKALLEKFINFAEDMEKIGDQIDRTGRLHSDAMRKLKTGNGSLVRQASQLQELGIKAKKKLSAGMLDEDENTLS